MEYLSLTLDMSDLVRKLLERRARWRAISPDPSFGADDTKPKHPSPENTVGEAPGANMEALDESCEPEDAASFEMSPDIELSSRVALEEHLAMKMSEDNQRDLVSALAQRNPSLRYVDISPWVFTDHGERKRYWEIVRDSRLESSYSPVVREVLEEDGGDQLWKLFQAADD
jgi:hypothetical protein